MVSEKTDDGYSGVNFDRPAFQEMMDEIRSGKVNCVVVKDLSRFGRNYIEAGNYIERVFPFMGVRFIAINDSYDSLDKNQSDSLIIPFKNLINDAYCKDISVKIRSQLEIKRKKGQFIGAFAVYGYLKCADCGQNMVRKHYVACDKEYTYFICSTRKAKKGCSTHTIKEDALMNAVLEATKQQVENIIQLEQMLKTLNSLPENQQDVFNYDAQIVKLKEEIERNKSFKLKLYENLQEGMIGQDEYFLFKKSYAAKIAEAEASIAAIEDERKQTVGRNRERLAWIDVYKAYQNITEISRKLVVDLIEQIRIFEGGRIEIKWRYYDEYQKITGSISKSQMVV